MTIGGIPSDERWSRMKAFPACEEPREVPGRETTWCAVCDAYSEGTKQPKLVIPSEPGARPGRSADLKNAGPVTPVGGSFDFAQGDTAESFWSSGPNFTAHCNCIHFEEYLA